MRKASRSPWILLSTWRGNRGCAIGKHIQESTLTLIYELCFCLWRQPLHALSSPVSPCLCFFICEVQYVRGVRSQGREVMRGNNTSFQWGEVSKHSDLPPTPSLNSCDELWCQREESEEGVCQGAGSPGPEVCAYGLQSAWVVSRCSVLREGHLSWCGVTWRLTLGFDEWTGDVSSVSLGGFWNSSLFHHCLPRWISNVSWICIRSICLYSFGRGHIASGIGQWIWPFFFQFKGLPGGEETWKQKWNDEDIIPELLSAGCRSAWFSGRSTTEGNSSFGEPWILCATVCDL